MRPSPLLYIVLTFGCGLSAHELDSDGLAFSSDDEEQTVPFSDDEEDTADEPSDTGEEHDTGEETTYIDPEIDFYWTSTGLMFSVTSSAQSLRLGIAQTQTSSGWFGEDCLNGTGGYQYCHEFSTLSGGLVHVEAVADVEEGSTTLLDEFDAYYGGSDDMLTYYLELEYDDDTTECFTWGHDSSYYIDLGCEIW